MLQNLLIPIGIMVTLAVLGWLTQALKNMQQKQQAEKELKRRESLPAAVPTRGPVPQARPGVSDVDRFLQEIDRLRQRGAGGGGPAAPAAPAPVLAPKQKAKPLPVPTIAPKKKVRLSEEAEPAPFVTTAPELAQRSTVRPNQSLLEDLPTATVVGASPPLPPPRSTDAPAASVVTRPLPRPISSHATRVTRVSVPTTPFGRQLMALLASPQSLPVAVVLTEILGQPKCRKRF